MNPHSQFRRSACWLMVLAISIGAAAIAHAHKQSDSYLTLRITDTNILGEWHFALRDLEDAVGLDANDDGVITWGELKSQEKVVCAYALSRLKLETGGKVGAMCVTGFLVDEHSDGGYAVIRFASEGFHPTRNLAVSYHALFDMDAAHRGLLRLEYKGRTRTAVFGPETADQNFVLQAPEHLAALAFVKEGVWHIWTGYDHLCFLFALLLPAVLQRRGTSWEPVPGIQPALLGILKVVTAFTVAHSITLSLACLGVVHLNSRLVESAIAASVVVAAFNNLLPFFCERGWLVAFGFGLIHGFGFANALNDLGLRQGALAMTLLSFNVGVELGQLSIVAVFLPFALGLRHLLFYQRIVLTCSSASIMSVAGVWLAERILDFKWLPF